MGLPKFRAKISVEDYLESEKSSPVRREYVVVDQYRMEVQAHRRQENGGWLTYYFTERSDIVEFTSVDLQIPLPEIYRRVTFEPNADRDAT